LYLCGFLHLLLEELKLLRKRLVEQGSPAVYQIYLAKPVENDALIATVANLKGRERMVSDR
jgi:hypothetical protein